MMEALYTLVRAGLWGKVEDLSHFPITTDRWAQLYKEAHRQAIGGIVFQGIMLLPEELHPPHSILFRWVAEADRIERNNKLMNETLNRLLTLFASHELAPMVLKGQTVATMYETPLLRECGDIDLYFDEKEQQKAITLLHEQHIPYETHADGSVCYTWNGIEVEHHPTLIDIQSPSKRRYIKSLMKELHTNDSYIKEIPSLSPTLNILLLNTHILKHCIGVGIGLRQLCDMARAYHYYKESLSHDTIREIYRQAGIETWSILLHAFMVKHLGLAQELQPYTNLEEIDTHPLQEIISRGGNFGKHALSSQKPVTTWQHKRQTLATFWRNRHFSWRYARNEALWTIIQLTKGTITH